jgi:DNA-binding NarL/FixJ family response regulator
MFVSTHPTGAEVPERRRILLVGAATLIRQGIARAVEGLAELELVGEAASVEDATRIAHATALDVVVVIGSREDLPDTVRAVRSSVSSGRILVLSEDPTAAAVREVLSAGADGYALSDTNAAEFAGGLRRFARGEAFLHPVAATALVDGLHPSTHRRSELTERQREIVRLLGLGLQNKQIARRLGIGVDTVKTHVSRVLRKLDAHSRTEAVVVALRDGLIS